MTEYTPRTSASDRIEAARKLADHLEQMMTTAQWMPAAEGIQAVHIIRALITPPSVGESVEQIAARVERLHGESVSPSVLLEMAVREGIYSAHIAWEPEVALRPTQEQMLRWLGIDCTIHAGNIFIPEQHIDRED